MPPFMLKEKVMRDRSIVITEVDAAKLRALVAVLAHTQRDQGHLEELAMELERANIIGPDEVPGDVVTMHTRVQVSRDFPAWLLLHEPGLAHAAAATPGNRVRLEHECASLRPD